MPKINPFKPGSPVHPGMFAGRITEILALERALLQTRAGEPENFIITGERGIGKSSLLNYLRWVAEGRIDLEETKLNYIVLQTNITKNTTQLDIANKISIALRRKLGEAEKAREWVKKGLKFLQRVEAVGIKVRDKSSIDSAEVFLEDFAYTLADLTNRLCDSEQTEGMFRANFDGIILLIDEADNSSEQLGLGVFFKLLLEKLQVLDCNKIMVGLAGLPELTDILRESHESSLRMFHTYPLSRLIEKDIYRAIDFALASGREKNPSIEEITITDEAKKLLANLSEGYPHFIQQYGYSAFDTDTDWKISEEDVKVGAFGNHGAIHRIGDGYYRNDFYNRIQKDSYRQVLRIMAGNLDGWVSKKEIRDKFQGGGSTLNNAIQALRTRHIIISKQGVTGVYRLQHKGFALWIKHFSTKPDELIGQLYLTSKENGSVL